VQLPSIAYWQFAWIAIAFPHFAKPASISAAPRRDSVPALKIHSWLELAADCSDCRAAYFYRSNKPPLAFKVFRPCHVPRERDADVHFIRFRPEWWLANKR
jgi:hypothetical protein